MYQKEKKRSKLWWVAIPLMLILIIIVAFFFSFRYYQSSLEPVDVASEKTTEIEILPGTSQQEVAEQLEEEEGLIQDSTLFNFYINSEGPDMIEAGYYQLSPGMDATEILNHLRAGASAFSENSLPITFPEGSNILEVASKISDATDIPQEEIIEYLQKDEVLQDLHESFPILLEGMMEHKDETLHPLEGYLFPATYTLQEGNQLEELIYQMIQKTDEVLQAYYPEIENQGKTVHDVLTLSSIVEKEASIEKDRRKIAGVFYNRLEEDMMLQTCVSISYAAGEHVEYVTYEDTEIDSPYNLYQNHGLGPGPVNNGSENSIQAVLDPTETDAFFFLADLDTETTYFSKTYEEHLEYQAQYIDSPSEDAEAE